MRSALPRSRHPLILAILLALGVMSPRVVQAQGEVTTPTVTLSPKAGSYDSDSLTITIEWCSATPLNPVAIAITLGGATVTSRFVAAVPAQTGCAVALARRGTVALTEGRNAFSATICDALGALCTETGATYVRVQNARE